MTQAEAPIEGWPGYSVTNDGKVFSTRYRGVNGAKTELSIFSDGEYACVNLTRKVEGKSQRRKAGVHRLVCEAFLPNPHGKRCVNHKDGNPFNNHIDNLEWCTHSENSRHSIDQLKRWPQSHPQAKGDASSHAKVVYRYKLDWSDGTRFGSLVSAGESLGIDKRRIHKAVKNSGTAAGYRWSYLSPAEIAKQKEKNHA